MSDLHEQQQGRIGVAGWGRGWQDVCWGTYRCPRCGRLERFQVVEQGWQFLAGEAMQECFGHHRSRRLHHFVDLVVRYHSGKGSFWIYEHRLVVLAARGDNAGKDLAFGGHNPVHGELGVHAV